MYLLDFIGQFIYCGTFWSQHCMRNPYFHMVRNKINLVVIRSWEVGFILERVCTVKPSKWIKKVKSSQFCFHADFKNAYRQHNANLPNHTTVCLKGKRFVSASPKQNCKSNVRTIRSQLTGAAKSHTLHTGFIVDFTTLNSKSFKHQLVGKKNVLN